MKSLLVVFMAVLIDFCGHAQGIRFNENMSWRDIKAKAKRENKCIFMDAYAAWCVPCKIMAEETFPVASVGDMFNKHFVSVKVQMDSTDNDNKFVKSWFNDARQIATQANITAYPTLLFFSPEGKLLHKSVGLKDSLALVQDAQNALDPSKQYFGRFDRFKKGELDTAQIKALAIQALQMGDNVIATEVANAYIKGIPGLEIYKTQNLVFISTFLSGSKDKHFKMFLKDSKRINEATAKNFAEETVMRVIAKEEVVPYEQRKNFDWQAIERRAVLKYGNLGAELVSNKALLYYLEAGDWVNFGKYYKKYFDLALRNDRSSLHINNISWPVFEHVTDTGVLATAAKAMKYSIEKFDQYTSAAPNAFDTYANLLYKTGKREEAIKLQERAVLLSNRSKEMVEALEKMKRNEKTWKD
jgi:thioredoxin-related protein